MNTQTDHYSISIQWNEPDKKFIASVPELPGCRTHGRTYEEALKNIQEVIPVWIDATKAHGWPIPAPSVLSEE